MSVEQKCALSLELRELYDIQNRKVRQEKLMSQQALEVKHDIKNLTIMFSHGIVDVSVEMSQDEHLEWDSNAKRLIYHQGDYAQFIEGVSNEVLIKIRPFLKAMVIKAKEFYL